MKFLEYTPFDSINLFLEQLNLGDCTMRVNLEAFSCKHTATDRRLSISLEHEAHLFFQEEELESFKQMVDTYLPDASRQWAATNEGSSLLDSMTKAIDEVIKIRECDIYSYNPDSDADPVLEKGSIWSFNYFFYNRKLKRVVSFCCYCTSKLSGDDFLTGAGW
ncbi:repressor of RNA polymerase III transcription MAF1 homolog isoform X2 [Sorghum bicolor]|uniref:Repressor of RNA polymerase III transcription n=1 Tax=Sorghum bicolor TaxID=4558 RepID=A0A1Z5R7P4_SORBI|nr:repressor of RNA polymerase III transcription MAF1 homolog isoform X2 [Sorghum bicolor]OQU79386.1 hypothetical protein SORBI_3008G136601 [Sorghum bicolor]|eukprot:XP_021301484.1 repressor of RNA polymerase III transcription MAF1 homolog isoform X2 [Sorghum bicolor]